LKLKAFLAHSYKVTDMASVNALGRREELTFKGNANHTRYGWLRLTPAYSVLLVEQLLDAHCQPDDVVLDPFCGTGTTALVCAERGLTCETTDINPFLIWLAAVKTRSYESAWIAQFRKASSRIAECIRISTESAWEPPIHQIEKWWSAANLKALGRAMVAIRDRSEDLPGPTIDLLKIVFCRVMIGSANVSFGHQSMSFAKQTDSARQGLLFSSSEEEELASRWEAATSVIADSANSPMVGTARVILCDARDLTAELKVDHYGCVVTSPPYPNRMSYIRELRPYMYWLGFLEDGRMAGELDWKAIGGTWGCATSNVAKWEPSPGVEIPHPEFAGILHRISQQSPVLAKYVHKYFYDMVGHVRGLLAVVRPGGSIHYIVGNSKFYDVLLPVESLFAVLFEAAGFERIAVRTIRKRTSKKELYEFVVSAHKPRK